MKDYLSVFFSIVLSHHVCCWEDSYYRENNVELNSHKNSDFTHSSEDVSGDHNSNYYFGSYEDENEQDYRDRVVFPDTKIDFKKNIRHTTPKSTNPKRDLVSCITKCNTVPDFDPVCGTDNVTYYNLDQLQCATKCGADVRLRQTSECPRLSEEPTTKSTSITLTDQLRSCMWSCPTTNEYNPVCGTDNVTYNNIGKLTCAQHCGVDVQFKRHFRCPKQPQTSTEPPTTGSSNVLSKETISCIQSCPATSEYSPVCGSNGKTYFNTGKLDCARYCGVDVTIVKRTSCPSLYRTTSIISDNNEFTTTTTPRPTISQDILDQIFNKRYEDQIDVRND